MQDVNSKKTLTILPLIKNHVQAGSRPHIIEYPTIKEVSICGSEDVDLLAGALAAGASAAGASAAGVVAGAGAAGKH